MRLHFEKFFAEAKDITGDYETVFGEDHKAIENRIPFYSDSSVPYWRELISQIHTFDFSKLDYEIIGRIFERLISPQERHKYGQFYTRAEVVDLIEAFCIRTGQESVMDPACGGGTFLVRAYARKRELSPSRQHAQLLSDLFGVDVSRYAAHLTTINLATRDLVHQENYPQIARSDFFDIAAHKTFVSLPKRLETKSLGKSHRKVQIPPLDAVVGNPPYLRQEDIPRAKHNAQHTPPPGTKEYYLKLVYDEAGIHLSGRSDLHCYFWPHSARFLKEDGYLCLLTSSQWLDVEYGFRLQQWILNNFRILAIFESVDEPWFVGARVATTVTCLQREPDQTKRMTNTVRFVQLRRPITEILAHDGSTAGAITAADGLRDGILSLSHNTLDERYRARLVQQQDLWDQGVELGSFMTQSRVSAVDPPDDENQADPDSPETTSIGDYHGSKWGIHLRAPDLWFGLLDSYAHGFAPLGRLADVRFGVKSGKDSFFFPIDCTSERLQALRDPEEFMQRNGVSRAAVESGTIKLVRCGEQRSEVRPVESCYLEPEIHSLMEIDGYAVFPDTCKRLIMLVGKPKAQLKGTHVLQYINWGERNGFHNTATCKGRVTNSRPWYDLTDHQRAPVLWPKERQYRHVAPINPQALIANCRLYEVFPPASHPDPDLWGGILNSTWVLLSSFQYGRPVGNEGNWSTMVVDVNMMLVPDPSNATVQSRTRVAQAFAKLKSRKALMFLSERRMRSMSYHKSGRSSALDALTNNTELDMPDRRELDDAVLEMIGVDSASQRQQLIDELYAYLRDFFEATRQKEEKAILNRNATRRRGPLRPADIAVQIHKYIQEHEPELLRDYESNFLDKSKPFDTYDLPGEGNAQPYTDMVTSHAVRFIKGAKTKLDLISVQSSCHAELLTLLANTGTRGLIRIPHDEADCSDTLDRYRQFIDHRETRLGELVDERTADEETQQNTLTALMSLVTPSPE
ncbi:MAG: N-6 DNA methylase [Chloroflexota bacterium]|nr:N-6 DNA methylase [Chloroflexota bacterium]